MVPETIFGLPAHVLVVHGAVVLVPLAAIGTLLIAVLPRLRDRYGVLVAIFAVLALGATFGATTTGTAFERSMELGGPVAEKVAVHAALGLQLRWIVLALAVAAVALVVLARRTTAKAVLTAVAVVAVLAAGASVVQVVRTGHAGSAAVWNPTG